MPVLNNIELTKMAIDTLDKNTFTELKLIEVIIIDDASNQETKDALNTLCDARDKFGLKTRLITNPERLGVTKSWNIGISESTGRFLAFCNNDILFGKNWDVPLIKAVANGAYVASPYHTAGNDRPKDWPAGKRRHNNGGFPMLGACFMLERCTFDKIGMFDERVKIWCNDNWLVDVVTQKHRKRMSMVKDSYVHHFYSKTCNESAVPGFTREAQADQAMYAKIRHEFIN
jgi:glycosyltransferase involved in cell wall biosynthesis